MDLALNNLQRLICHKPKQQTTINRLCNRGSAGAVVFARSIRSSVLSTSVIVSAGYYLLL